MNKQLKPCPFCGQIPDADDPRAFIQTQGDKWGAVQCCITGPEVRTGYRPLAYWKDDAKEEWNTRQDSEDLNDEK